MKPVIYKLFVRIHELTLLNYVSQKVFNMANNYKADVWWELESPIKNVLIKRVKDETS